MTPAAPLPAAGPAPPSEAARRAQIHETAQKYETSFLSIMLQQMFEGVESGGTFGGGHGESMFKSFLTEAMAKQTARAGGVGIAAQVEREMLKMQGLS
jgi:Rod binding domain-containing protein